MERAGRVTFSLLCLYVHAAAVPSACSPCLLVMFLPGPRTTCPDTVPDDAGYALPDCEYISAEVVEMRW